MFFLPALAAGLSLFTTSCSASLLHLELGTHDIPLVKRGPQLGTGFTESSGRVNMTAVKLSAIGSLNKFTHNTALLKHKHQAGSASHRRHRRRRAEKATSDSEYLTEYGESYIWTGPITAGSPSKSFTVVFDTGSTDFLLVGTNCTASECQVNGSGETRARYNASASSTAEVTSTTFSDSYVSGSATTGNLVYDHVNFGKLEATQGINVASAVGGSLASLPADGVMGFAYPALSSEDLPAFPTTLYESKSINKPVFGFRLSAKANDSLLSIGYFNTKKFSGTMYNYTISKDPVATSLYTYYQIANSWMRVNGKSVSATTGTYIIDSGTSFIISPKIVAQAFWKKVPNSEASADYEGYYTWPCNQTLTMAFSFGNNTNSFAVANEDLNLGYVDHPHGRCLGALVGVDAGMSGRTIVGDVFMKSWYTGFDFTNKTIGFAKPL